MSRVYCVTAENQTLVTACRGLVAFRTAADAITPGGLIEILRIEIGQRGTVTSGQIAGEVFTRDTAGTLTMTSATPRPLNPMGGAASALIGNTAPAGGATRVGVNSSVDSGGTYTSIMSFNFNNLNGYLWVPTPEERMVVPPATVSGIRILADPATMTGWTFALTFRELS